MNASRLLLLSIALSPAILLGQKKEDILSIQRDVATLDEHVKQIQKSLDDKIAAMTAMLQQSIDASNKASASLQQAIDLKLSDQQTKLVAPVATLGSKLGEMSGDLSAVKESVRELIRKMNDLDGKVTDINSSIRTLQTPVAAPPPPNAAANGTAPQSADTPPPGMSVDLSYTAALGDYNGKRDELALDEFMKYVHYFPQSANAPNAQYYIGQIYYRAKDYSSAAKAFDDVLEKFPKNPKTAEAQYLKACSLMNAHEKNAAGKEFKSFLSNYPDNPKAVEAHKHLVELGLETPKRRAK